MIQNMHEVVAIESLIKLNQSVGVINMPKLIFLLVLP